LCSWFDKLTTSGRDKRDGRLAIVTLSFRSLRDKPPYLYHASVRALLVEDDATIADFVARGLREAGFAVDHFADGDAGLLIDSGSGAVLDHLLGSIFQHGGDGVRGARDRAGVARRRRS